MLSADSRAVEVCTAVIAGSIATAAALTHGVGNWLPWPHALAGLERIAAPLWLIFCIAHLACALTRRYRLRQCFAACALYGFAVLGVDSYAHHGWHSAGPAAFAAAAATQLWVFFAVHLRRRAVMEQSWM